MSKYELIKSAVTNSEMLKKQVATNIVSLIQPKQATNAGYDQKQ